jgi:hypothetical protein
MKRLKKGLIISGVASMSVLFSGCSISSMIMSNSPEDPVIENAVGHSAMARLFRPFGSSKGMSVISTTASRRSILIDNEANIFCAEPPADVAQNIIDNFQASLVGKISKDNTSDKSLEVEALKNLSLTLEHVFKPMQGIRFAQSGWYSLCQMYMNDANETKDKDGNYSGMFNYIAKLANEQINTEINASYKLNLTLAEKIIGLDKQKDELKKSEEKNKSNQELIKKFETNQTKLLSNLDSNMTKILDLEKNIKNMETCKSFEDKLSKISDKNITCFLNSKGEIDFKEK